MIDIVITSDIRIYCEGLGLLLSRACDVNVKAIVDDSESAVEAISTHAPRILLLDMTMAGSCRLASQISRQSPQTRIVALAVSYDESNIVHCAEAGVTCYVPRESSVEQLLDAIREAARGQCYCPPKIAACLLNKMQHLASSAKNKNPPIDDADHVSANSAARTAHLTPREQQIAGFLAEGLSNKQIARDLNIEVSTVKNHVHNLLVKLEVSNRSQAVFRLRNESI